MKLKLVWLAAGVSALGLVACSKGPSTPASPSSAAQASAAVNADGSTLKASPPTPVSPPNGQKLDQGTTDGIQLVINNAVSKFNVGLPVAYHFQLFNAAGVKIEDSGLVAAGSVSTSYVVTSALDGDQTYSWWARAEVDQGAYVGSWSPKWTFIAPVNEGYISGSELYDPLDNGKTVGTIVGPVHFVPGVGISLDSLDSYVQYQLPQTLVEGEFSILATNVRTHTEGGKTKIMAMAEGFSDITTNNRRLTYEKRNDGTMAWRMITHDDQIDTSSPERVFVQFNLTDTFFFGLDWHNNVLTPTVRQGGATGPLIYTLPKHWNGAPYDPNPHVIYLGGPGGRAGSDSGTVPNIIIRQVWVSGRPRPAFANK